MTPCERVQRILTEEGPRGLRHDAVGIAHLTECDDCFGFLEALTRVDSLLADAPVIDAPEETVRGALARVAAAMNATAAAAPAKAEVAGVAKSPARLARIGAVLQKLAAVAITPARWLRQALAALWAFLKRRNLFRLKILLPAGGALAALCLLVLVGTTMTLRSGGDAYWMADEGQGIVGSGTTAPAATPSADTPKQAEASEGFEVERERYRSPAAPAPKPSPAHAAARPSPPPPPPEPPQLQARDRQDVGASNRPARITAEQKKAEVAARFSKLFAGSGGAGPGSGSGSILGGGGGGSLSGTLSSAIGDSASGSPTAGMAGMGVRGAGPAVAADQEELPKLKADDAVAPVPRTSRGIAGIGTSGRLGGGGLAYGSSIGLGRKQRDVTAGGVPMIMGALPIEVIKKVIDENKNQIRYCYERELQRDPTLEGKISVRWIISATGSVASVVVREATLDSAEVQSCMRAKIGQWRFPPPAGGGVVEISYPFLFKSDYDDVPSDEETPRSSRLPAPAPTETEPVPTGPAADFLAERENTTGLVFKDASGYWANTYVPGDPTMRLLQTRLASSSRASLLGSPGLRLDDAARQYAQPFDVPDSAALGVYLQADTRTLQEEGRVLVEVGLKGTPRHSGSRPAMNVAMVLDARGTLAPEAGNVMRALAMALGRAKSAGDRFALVLAGKPGGVVVSPNDFRAGPITVAVQQALGETEPAPGPALSLAEAMTAAAALVLASDDPNAPLGSSAVILVTSQALASELAAVRDLANESAVNGVPTSVVGVGAGVLAAELDEITLAGQGNRRLCDAIADADGVVTRELLASSRVIARAVRLRIRLAPGVRLVDVIGSHRLDEEQEEAVRRAEKSVDRRLARSLGLASDRGEDEDGIQIVIPSFYAGDTHAILLDVVAPGPGPVAEVRVRYKDLVFMRNGVARSQLSLARGPKVAGPLELSVRKNLLARRVHDTLRVAGDALSRGDASTATRYLATLESLLSGLKRFVPAWASDPDLTTDLGMIAEYRTLVQQADGFSGNQRDYVADSLRYAGYLKVLPRAARDPGAQSPSGE